MVRARSVTYECEQCGSEIVVTSTGEGELSPIYCCGIEVTEATSTVKKSARPGKKVVKKSSATKGTTNKSRPAGKKKPER